MTESHDHARQTGPALEALYQFLLWLLPTVEKLPRGHKFVLGDRIQTTALDVLDALLAATYTRSRDRQLADANLGLERLRVLMRLSHDMRLIDSKRYDHAARSLDDIGRLVGGWVKAHRARAA